MAGPFDDDRFGHGPGDAGRAGRLQNNADPGRPGQQDQRQEQQDREQPPDEEDRNLQRRRSARLKNDQYRIFLPPDHGRPDRNKYRKWHGPIEEVSNFNFREIAGQRPFNRTTMDPFNMYYSLGADKNHENITFEVADSALGNYYSAPEDPELESLSYAPPGSYIVNWSYGGFGRTTFTDSSDNVVQGQQGRSRLIRGGRNRGQTVYQGGEVLGFDNEQQARYFAALGSESPTTPNSPAETVSNELVFTGGMTYNDGSSILTEDFNMLTALNQLWQQTDYGLNLEGAMQQLKAYLPPRIKVRRNRLTGEILGLVHGEPAIMNPVTKAMINSVGLVSYGEGDDDFRLDDQGVPRLIFLPLGNGNYQYSQDAEIAIANRIKDDVIREMRRRSGGRTLPSEREIDERIIEFFYPGAYLQPSATVFDVYDNILRIKGDTPALRERLQTIFLSMMDNPTVRSTAFVPDGMMEDMVADLPTLSDISSASFAEYEYYSFKTEAPFVRDQSTATINKLAGTPSRQRASIFQGAFVRPKYNFFLEDYENAISDPRLSERALPNMYIYKLSSDTASPDDQNVASLPPWSDDNQNANIEPGYDGQIRLQEFLDNGVPKLSDGPTDELIELFNNFGTGNTGEQDIVFEFSSERSNQYYNSVVEGGDIRIFEDFNYFKKSFPMYIEVGIPTQAPGIIGNTLGYNFTSATVSNAILKAQNTISDEVDMELLTTEIDYDVAGATVRPYERKISIGATVSIYDFNQWMDTFWLIFSDLQDDNLERRVDSIGFNRNNYGPGLNNIVTLQSAIQGVKFWVRHQARFLAPDYRDLIAGRKTECATETIMYKLVKYKISNGQKEVVANYYFPNTPSEALPYGNKITDIIKFVDTQVKYGTDYEYELFNVDAVYGAKYRFRRRFRELPLAPLEDSFDNRAFYSFNVETIPCIKIIEYPVISDEYRRATGIMQMDEANNTGVSYPVAKVLDYPPPAPLVNLVPYAGDPTKMLVMLNTQGASFLRRDARDPIPFDQNQAAANELINRYQRTFDYFDLPPNKLQYRGEGLSEIQAMIIYRSTNIDPVDMYREFIGKAPYRIISTRPDAPPIQAVASYDFIDDLKPNTKYYYVFKCIDVHNKYSFPSEVYEVQMISDKGLFIPEIKIYEPEVRSGKKETKPLVRFLEISAADIQKLPIQESVEDEPPSFSSRSLVNGNRCIADSNGEKVEKFVVRLTSKDTGKKIDLVINFNINEEQD